MANVKQQHSAFVERIRNRLNSLGISSGRLIVSVANNVEWEQSDLGDEVLVRWVCWSIEDQGVEISGPEFEVLSQVVTREQLSKELPALFPGVEVLVDDDIDV